MTDELSAAAGEAAAVVVMVCFENGYFRFVADICLAFSMENDFYYISLVVCFLSAPSNREHPGTARSQSRTGHMRHIYTPRGRLLAYSNNK